METFLSGISVLWILTAVLQVTAGQVCDRGWVYHDLTATCMRLTIKQYVNSFKAADLVCGAFKGGSHLVYILNQQTDDFVKGLLTDRDDFALIGLNDRAQNGNYIWGDPKKFSMSYQGWRSKQFNADNNKHSVIITKDGWVEYQGSGNMKLVCQVDAVLPQPEMACPAAEEGAERSSIVCRIDFNEQVNVTEMSIYRAGQHIVSCGRQTCGSNQRYMTSIETKELGENRYWSMTFTIKKVERRDEATWSCQATFSNSNQTSSACDLQVYVVPQDIRCGSRFTSSSIEVTCQADKVYPKLICAWEIYRDTVTVGDYQSLTDGRSDRTCKVSFESTRTGVYRVTVFMRPELNNSQALPYKTQEISVPVALPEKSPELSTQGRVISGTTWEVTENDTVRITCKVPGGTPPVSSTRISCSNVQEISDPSESATINFKITRYLHQKSCTCFGNHITGFTQVGFVNFLVKFPVTITTFTMQEEEVKAEVRSGQTLRMKCTAEGYPQPWLSLHKDGGETLAVKTSTEVTHSMAITTCRDTGRYVCSAQNEVNKIPFSDNKHVDLRVRCAPERCDPSNEQIGVAVEKDVTDVNFTICVFAYPSPTLFILSKVPGSGRLDKSKYEASFVYRNETIGQGEIRITLSSFTMQDLGNYQLYSDYKSQYSYTLEFHSYLTFQLIARGPPHCPTNFTVSEIYPDSVTLSWISGFNGGLEQTFTVLRYDASDNMSYPLNDHGILQKEENSRDVLSYNITGLSESTMYQFGIQVKNEEGATDCSYIQVNVLTAASDFSGDDQNVTTIVAPIIIVLILVALVAVAVFVLIHRRRSKTEKTVVLNQGSTVTSTEQITTSSRNEGGENVYANTNNGENTAANKLTRDEKKSKQDNDKTYAEVNKNNKKKGKNQCKNKKVHSNEETALYSNTSPLNVPETSGAADQENIYANATSPKKNKKADEKEDRDDGRRVNEEGLVYVSVEINKKTTNPEIVSGSKAPVVPATNKMAKVPVRPKEESVEYMAIDFRNPVKGSDS